jgi:hypothetical protein
MVNETESSNDPRYLPEAQAFSACTICDEEYSSGTDTCPKCHSILSKVRRCPDCHRIVSSRHETCIYCAFSLLAIHAQPRLPEEIVAIPRERNRQQPDKMKAVVVAFSVFLVIVLFGINRMMRSNSATLSPVKATSFAVHNAALHLEASDQSGVGRAITNGTIVRLTRIVRDNTGRPWYMVTEDGKEMAIKVDDVAPPKVSEPEEGSKMLQAWLLQFDHPELAQDAVQAVNYYCSEFPTSSHCEELRWVAAQRLRYLAQHSPKRSELIAQTRELFKTLATQNGPHAEEARKSLDGLAEPSATRNTERDSPVPVRTAKSSKAEFRQYALVDAAEVQLRIPDLSTLKPGSSIRTPIAKEIRVNGQLVVPSNATCVLEILNPNTQGGPAVARLTAIEFNNRSYPVTTEPKRLEKAGSIVVFRLDSSLLIGH